MKETDGIPNQNNLYGSISNVESKKALADMFGLKGWSIGKSTWTDFELVINWCEIVIEKDDNSPLIHGAIDPNMFDNFRQLLDSFMIKYSLELYDEQGTLM